MTITILVQVKGGPGSGNWGHAGRPGMVGGSTSGVGTFVGVVPGFEKVKVPSEYTRVGKAYRAEFDFADVDYVASVSTGRTMGGDIRYMLSLSAKPRFGSEQRRNISRNTAEEVFDVVESVKTGKLNYNQVR